MASPIKRVDQRNTSGMRAVEARNIKEAQRNIDVAVSTILKRYDEQMPLNALARLISDEIDKYSTLAKRLAVERVRDSVRRGVVRSSVLLKVLGIDPDRETMYSLVSRTVSAEAETLATAHAESVAADLKQRLISALIEQSDEDQASLRVKIKEAVAGPRNRAAIGASDQTIEVHRQTMTEVYKLNGIAMVTWYTAMDERVCDICRLRHGKRYRMDRIPEPHKRCRCTLLPDDGGPA
jgi:SPP1 gp7 family putative phage head morphogenesis protein